MADILIRDLPDDVVAAIDAKARRAGLSRSEYVRRALCRERSDTDAPVSVVDLERFSERFAAKRSEPVRGPEGTRASHGARVG